MSEAIHMTVVTPGPIRVRVPQNAIYVTFEDLAAILREYVSTGDLETALANYATKNELDNETIMRWGSGGNNNA